MPVEKQRCIRGESVLCPLIGQEAMNGQEIAKNADAPLGGVAALRDGCSGSVALCDGGKEFHLDGCLHGLGQLVGIYGVEKALRSGLLMRDYGGHGFLLSVQVPAV